MNPREILENGRQILDPILLGYGFAFKETQCGKSSGGLYASGRYEKGDRYIEVHYRGGLGLVRFHIGKLSLNHENYMFAQLGPKGGNKYPGFSDNPIDAFRDLAYDLESFCKDFLSGSGRDFAQCVEIAKKSEKRPGFSRMTEFES